jgi:hypothetical protein
MLLSMFVGRLQKGRFTSLVSGITKSWGLVEREVRNLPNRHRVSGAQQVSTMQLIATLSEKGVVQPAIASVIAELYSLRNTAVHGQKPNIPTAQAVEYVHLALRIVNYLRQY